ncbi:MAG: hypothetical protein ACP5VS_00045 [Desulfomonilaceae bacterium]
MNRFDYGSLNLSPKTIHPTADDLKVIHNLNRLDQYIMRCADYEKYEELLWDVQHGCLERFCLWLTDKGIEEHQDIFAYLTDTYITFIYGYPHEEPVTLKSGPGKYFVEFMVAFLLLKTSMEPWEYTLCPAAMRLFYKFLHEKGYLVECPDRMIVLIDRLEPHFIEILMERFS